MAGSSSEREIRNAVAATLRVALPYARIIHELPVGGSRADLAAVEPSRVLLFEIKSEKDVLDRLATQMRDYCRAAHGTVLVAHRKWFDQTPYANGHPRLAWAHETDWRCTIWAYPEPDASFLTHHWNLPAAGLAQPHAASLLFLLWRDELMQEAGRHGIGFGKKARVPDLVHLMAWHMTGRQVAEAVCRQLRARAFPEADAPILAAEPAALSISEGRAP